MEQVIILDNYIVKLSGYCDYSQYSACAKTIFAKASELSKENKLQGKKIVAVCGQTKPVSDFSGPSWSHYTDHKSVETKVEITFLANLSLSKLERDLDFGWLLSGKVQWSNKYYGGNMNVALQD